jgi:predicted type IV restriction endonuclease
MGTGQGEAFSRILIDKALEFSGWNLLDPQQVVFELHTGSGRADYLLKDKLGRVLCVLEAKREDLDPYDAKEQARGYAEYLLCNNGSRAAIPISSCGQGKCGDSAPFLSVVPAGLGRRDLNATKLL